MTPLTDNPRIDAEFTTPGSRVPLLDRVRLSVADYAEGLDLNHWRPGVDLRVAKQQGIRFIITKATQGDYYTDDTYEHYRDESKAKGLPFGAYMYWDAAIDPLKQAKYFFDHVGDDPELLPVWDIEKYGNQGVLEPTTAAQQLNDGLQETARLFDRDVMIYTSRDSWTVLTANSSIIAAYPLWVANWTSAAQPTLPVGASEWVFWQYTNQYQVVGYNRGLDANRFNGNEAQFEAYVKSLNGQPPPTSHDHPDYEAEHENMNALLDKHDKDITAIIGQLQNQQTEIDKLQDQMSGIGKAASE